MKKRYEPGPELDMLVGDVMVYAYGWSKEGMGMNVYFAQPPGGQDELRVGKHLDEARMSDWSPSTRIGHSWLVDVTHWTWMFMEIGFGLVATLWPTHDPGETYFGKVPWKDYPDKAAAYAHARCLAVAEWNGGRD